MNICRRSRGSGGSACQKRAWPFFDKRLAVCRAHNLFAESEQIPHLQTEKCFLRRTRRRKKRVALYLPPAGGKLCEAFLTDSAAAPAGAAAFLPPFVDTPHRIIWRKPPQMVGIWENGKKIYTIYMEDISRLFPLPSTRREQTQMCMYCGRNQRGGKRAADILADLSNADADTGNCS